MRLINENLNQVDCSIVEHINILTKRDGKISKVDAQFMLVGMANLLTALRKATDILNGK